MLSANLRESMYDCLCFLGNNGNKTPALSDKRIILKIVFLNNRCTGQGQLARLEEHETKQTKFRVRRREEQCPFLHAAITL